MPTIRVFLVDDHTLVRTGIRALLASYPDIMVVGEASNGQELLDQLPTTPTDVVLLDVNMPVLDGPTVARQLREQYPAMRILALSMQDKEDYIFQMLDAGALGYMLKHVRIEEIVQGIQTVAAGRQFLCSATSFAALNRLRGRPETPVSVVPKESALSRRETEVLQLLSEGLTTNEIAERLFTSKRTIETHRQNILDKTQMKNTAALIRFAVEGKLVS